MMLCSPRMLHLLLHLCIAFVATATPSTADDPPVHTFSIVAFDEHTGDLGVAVASRVLAVGAIVPYVEADVGAVATQSAANSSYGPSGLRLLRSGASASEAVDELTMNDELREIRQLGIVDARGRSAAFTGSKCIPYAGQISDEGFTIQGNMLTGGDVLEAMKTAFVAARDSGDGELADWLLAALCAGESKGGDQRGKQAAGLIVARKGAGYDGNDRYIDLRVDDHTEPATELKRLLELHKNLFRRAHENPPSRPLPTPTN